MIEVPEFLPLGSVVTLKGNSKKKLMIVGRALLFEKSAGVHEYYDYSLCLYPEGLMGDAVLYGNHDQIDEVVERGFEDKEDEAYRGVVATVVGLLDLSRGIPGSNNEW